MQPRPFLSFVSFFVTFPLGMTAQQQLVNGGLPSVSPNGSLIAFISNRGGSDKVFVVGADGTGEREVTRRQAQRPSWTTDGREILFAGGGTDSGHVFAAVPNGSVVRIVATVPGRNPVLSPDGARALSLIGPWTSTVTAVVNTDGSSLRQIAGGGATAWNGAWSPDGARIAYTYGDSTHLLQVHVVNADGTSDRGITHMNAKEGSAQLPAWSPDGRQLAVQVSNARSHTAHIWIIDVETGDSRKLAAHAEPYLDEAPAWFPGGRRIAFQSNRTGRMEIWVMNVDGLEQHQVTR